MPRKLEIKQEGNLESDTALVFLQGWPDNYRVWAPMNCHQQLSQYRLLFINLPNTNGDNTEKWGVDFPELTDDIKFTIDQTFKDSSITNKILVGHDWGCYYSYFLDEKYPRFFNQLIMMDVPGVAEVKGLKPVLYVLCYQMYLAFAFLIGGPLGKIMTQKLCGLFRHSPPYFSRISGAQNYPYYYLWRNVILGGLKMRPRYLKGYKPSVPIVYLYAAKKPFQFHGARWLSLFNSQNQSNKNNEIHEMQCGHWIMNKYPKFITDLICRRIKLRL